MVWCGVGVVVVMVVVWWCFTCHSLNRWRYARPVRWQVGAAAKRVARVAVVTGRENLVESVWIRPRGREGRGMAGARKKLRKIRNQQQVALQ